MQTIRSRKPLAIALGAAFALTGAAAHASVFQTNAMTTGYMVADATAPMGDAKTGEHKCGEKKAEHKCGDKTKMNEGKCGEGKCGDKRKANEGKCGEAKCGDKK